MVLGCERLDVSGDALRTYFDRLWSLTLPIGLLFNGMAGLDGTSFHGALFGDLQSEIRFQWWSDPPPITWHAQGIAWDIVEI